MESPRCSPWLARVDGFGETDITKGLDPGNLFVGLIGPDVQLRTSFGGLLGCVTCSISWRSRGLPASRSVRGDHRRLSSVWSQVESQTVTLYLSSAGSRALRGLHHITSAVWGRAGGDGARVRSRSCVQKVLGARARALMARRQEPEEDWAQIFHVVVSGGSGPAF